MWTGNTANINIAQPNPNKHTSKHTQRPVLFYTSKCLLTCNHVVCGRCTFLVSNSAFWPQCVHVLSSQVFHCSNNDDVITCELEWTTRFTNNSTIATMRYNSFVQSYLLSLWTNIFWHVAEFGFSICQLSIMSQPAATLLISAGSNYSWQVKGQVLEKTFSISNDLSTYNR